jgi:hypothetical protein
MKKLKWYYLIPIIGFIIMMNDGVNNSLAISDDLEFKILLYQSITSILMVLTFIKAIAS